jgi:transposase
MMEAIFYVMRTGCQWKLLPRCIAAGSTAHDRFQEWEKQGVIETLWEQGLLEYDERKGIDWTWQSMDGALTKAPLGGEATGPNPTDRGKTGTKRSVLVDGGGVMLGLSVAGANKPDMKLVKPTLDNLGIGRAEEGAQHLCLDKGYDYPEVRDLVEARGYIEHIQSRGEESQDKARIPGYRARRWVAERTHSWMNRFRRLLVRWEKKERNYIAFLKLAGAYIAFRAAGVVP